jgi:hypothetical protein
MEVRLQRRRVRVGREEALEQEARLGRVVGLVVCGRQPVASGTSGLDLVRRGEELVRLGRDAYRFGRPAQSAECLG